MEEKRLKDLKHRYKEMPIPSDELKDRVLGVIAKEQQEGKTHKSNRRRLSWLAAAAAAIVILPFNVVEGLAASVSGIPILGTIAGIVTVREFGSKDDESHYSAEIKVPEIGGGKAGELWQLLNETYLAEGQNAYEAFMESIEATEEGDIINRALDMGFDIVTNDGGLLVIMRYIAESAGSSIEKRHYDTLDVQQRILLTLPSLFQGDDYIRLLNEEIIRQMKTRAEQGEGIFYIYAEDGIGFTSVTKEQSFYINKERKLVISFDEYEVAPGYMGVVEFEIPTAVIQEQLVSNYYIK